MNDVEDPVGRIFAAHAQLLVLCMDLEKIADRLPLIDARVLKDAVARLTALSAQHAKALSLLDQFACASAATEVWAVLRSGIVRHQQESENLGLDIADALHSRDLIGCVRDAGMVGYMLRCFFEGYRRAILVEKLSMFAMSGSLPMSMLQTRLIDRIKTLQSSA